MKIQHKQLTFDTGEGVDILNITTQLQAFIDDSGVSNGLLIVNSRHTTTALAVNEYESRLLDDIKVFFAALAPADKRYLHNDIHLRDCPPDEPENAHSHLLAMLLNTTECLSVADGKMVLGQWQSVLFFELDGPRQRSVLLQLIG